MSARKKEERIKRFCEEYLVDLNATQAAIRAGYAPRAANVQGCRLMKREDVKAEIARLKAERGERAQISADDVLREVSRIAFADEDLLLVTPRDKLKALDMLMRHLGLFTKDNEQKGNSGMQEIAAAILGKVAGAGGVTVEGAGAD